MNKKAKFTTTHNLYANFVNFFELCKHFSQDLVNCKGSDDNGDMCKKLDTGREMPRGNPGDIGQAKKRLLL